MSRELSLSGREYFHAVGVAIYGPTGWYSMVPIREKVGQKWQEPKSMNPAKWREWGDTVQRVLMAIEKEHAFNQAARSKTPLTKENE